VEEREEVKGIERKVRVMTSSCLRKTGNYSVDRLEL